MLRNSTHYIFIAYFITITLILGVVSLPILILPVRYCRIIARIWVRLVLMGCAHITGVTYRLHYTNCDRDYVQHNPAIIAANHQSTFETLLLSLIIPNVSFIVKKELLYIPIFGWYLWRVGMIAIDRKQGIKALYHIKEQAKIILENKRSIVIFPQGTRTKIGEKNPITPGVSMLYQHDVPFIICTHNAGQYWPHKNGYITPGIIDVHFTLIDKSCYNKKTIIPHIDTMFYER